jgi:hypothetical protein
VALDRSVLGNMAQAQMEALEQAYGENENVQIGGVVTIVEVIEQTDDGQITSTIRKRHNIGEPYRAIGILRLAEQQVIQTFSEGGE